MDELQRTIGSRHFNELAAYAKRNTLNPDQWWSTAQAMSMVIAAISGQWIDPAMIVPGQIDPEKAREAKERAAEKAMDREASRQ